MKKKHIILTLVLWLTVINCTANLLNQNVIVRKSQKLPSSNNSAVLSSFQFFSGNAPSLKLFRNEYQQSLKNSIVSSIYNSGLFNKVLVKDNRAKEIDQSNTFFFDVRFSIFENSSFNWWSTWPAVYPLPGYWPVQSKSGSVKVIVDVNVFKGKSMLKPIHLEENLPFDITFYGFYRTSPIEKIAEKLYYNSLSSLSMKIRKRKKEYNNSSGESFGSKIFAILDLESVNLDKKETLILSDIFRSEIAKLEKFKTVERSKMNEILKEQAFQQTGCTTDSCKVEVGKLLGVAYLITGNVGKIGELHHISLRIINVETGQIMKYLDEQIKGKVDGLVTKAIPKIVHKLKNL